MKRSAVWRHGEPISKSTCYGSTDAGRIATGGIWAVICRRTYALSRIRLQCVRGLLSHNDSDPLQQMSAFVQDSLLAREGTNVANGSQLSDQHARDLACKLYEASGREADLHAERLEWTQRAAEHQEQAQKAAEHWKLIKAAKLSQLTKAAEYWELTEAAECLQQARKAAELQELT